MKQNCFWFLLSSAALLFSSNRAATGYQDVRLPPSIAEHPKELNIIHRDGDNVVLKCRANGIPPPEYLWKKNGEVLEFPPNIKFVKDSEGTIEIRNLSRKDEGYYQCRAGGQYGVSVSKVVQLQRAVLVPLPVGRPESFIPARVGLPYSLMCVPTKSVPRPSVTWAVYENDRGIAIPKFIIPDNRIQIDEDGHLHFAHVLASDGGDNVFYFCTMYNYYLDVLTEATPIKLNVITDTDSEKYQRPQYLFSSSLYSDALEGRNLSLRCFFSGFPAPKITWSRKNGTLPVGRFTVTKFNTELIIRNVEKSDQGEYECTASNRAGNQIVYSKYPIVLQVGVQAAPVFESMKDRPNHQNVTEGDSVTMNCEAYAVPEAQINWMRNGIVLTPYNMPERYHLSKDNKQLRISNVCRTCAYGTSDLAVIQCNASNVHGYALGEGYINVLKRTEIVEGPEDVYLSADDSSLSVTFNCRATSDDSTPVEIMWYLFHTEGQHGTDQELLLYDFGNIVSIAPDGTQLSIKLDLTSQYNYLNNFIGEYKCVAYNGYSSAEARASLILKEKVSDKNKDKNRTPKNKYKKDSSKSDSESSSSESESKSSESNSREF